MSKQKRQVRLTTASVTNPDTGEKEVHVRAETKLNGKSVVAQGADEPTAVRALEDKFRKALARNELRAEYPKTIEVGW